MKPKQFNNLNDLKKEIEAYVKITEKKYKKPKDLPPHLVLYNDLEKNNELPSSDKNSSTKIKFENNLKYKNLVNDLNYPNGKDIIKYDTWYKDPFYGRIDYIGNPIYHNYWVFQNISSNPAIEICVFDFVADAFDEMKKIYGKKKKSQNSTFLRDLGAKKGNSSTIAPEIKYQQYINQRFQNFLSERAKELKLNKNIKNFNDFKKIFINHLKANEGILTLQGFFDNINVDIYDSYLAFDIYDDNNNPSNITKIDFLNDPNYNTYETAARQAGFFVDQNKPWRLVADLQSKAIVAAMKRRYKVTEELLKTKDDIYKLMTIKNNVFSQDVLLSGSENLNYLISLVFGNLVQDKKNILNFADYFKKEIPNLQKPVKILRDIFATYIDDKKVITSSLTLDQVDFPKKNIKIADLNVKEVAFKIYKAIYDISFVFDDNRFIIDYIYQSLESQLKVLEVINKPIEQITNKDVYSAVYCQISDYAYFTYLPKKMQQFYEIFLNIEERDFYVRPENALEETINVYGKFNFNNYNSYVVFSKISNNNTKASYNSRQPIDLSKFKLTDNLQNDFYSLDLLIDHLEYRIYEEKAKITEQTKNEIINQVKSLYEKSLEEYKKDGNYSYYRNLALSIIEKYVYSSIDSKKTFKNMKKAPFFAQQYFYKAPETEPLIMVERICLTLPERGDILLEEEICGKFDLDLNIAESPQQSKSGLIVNGKCLPPLTSNGDEDCPQGTLWNFKECKCLKYEPTADKGDWSKAVPSSGCKEPQSGCPEGAVFADENGNLKDGSGRVSKLKCLCVNDDKDLDTCVAPKGGCAEDTVWDPFICKCKKLEEYKE